MMRNVLMLKTMRHFFAIVLAIVAVMMGGRAFGQGDDIAELLLEADETRFAEFFPRGVIYENIVKRVERAIPVLLEEINRRLPAGTNVALKEKLAKRQANAAIVLLKLNQPNQVWPLFKHSPDPTTRSHLIHRLQPLGVDARTIVDHLNNESDITICRALILSLGEFREESLLPKDRKPFQQKLQSIYGNDTDSGLHASAEWLLRKWNQEEWLNQVNEVWAKDPEKGSRHWYVNGHAQTLVVIPGPVEFMMGSPAAEMGRKKDEPQHIGRIEQSFAIAAKEVTVEQFLRFRKYFSYVEYHSPKGACPINNVAWYEAAAYCNWLSEQEGIPKDQWCYAPNMDGEYKAGMKIVSHHLERTGYRLPTEMEWEYACRAGSETRCSFGDSEELFAKYEWIRDETDDWPRPILAVGTLKPNDLGLFDMHGSVREWCHDSYGPYADSADLGGIVNSEADTIIDEKNRRVLRGGSFTDPWWGVRSARRDDFSPRYCDASLGFRLARTIKPALPTAKNGNAENTGK